MKTTSIIAATALTLALGGSIRAQSRIVASEFNGSSLKLTDDAGKVSTITLKQGESPMKATQDFMKAHSEYAPKPAAVQPAAAATSQTTTTLVRDESKPSAKQQTQEPKK